MTTEQTQGQETGSVPFGHPDFKPASHADDAELAQIEADLRAAEAGGGGGAGEGEGKEGEKPADGQGADPQAGDKPAGEGAPAQGDDKSQAQGQDGRAKGEPMIPHWRFKQAQETAYWRGRAELAEELARGKSAGDEPAGDKQPTPQELVAALDQGTDEAAKKYDAGEISFAQYKQVERTNERKIAELSKAAAQSQPGQDATREDFYLAERTDGLATEFKILTQLTAAQVEPLVSKAYAFAELNDIPITPDARGDYTLRRIVAQLAQQKYAPKNSAPASDKSPAVDPSKADDKLKRLGNLPPNLSHLSAGAPKGSDPLSPERFVSMDVDDIAALPETMTKRFAGR